MAPAQERLVLIDDDTNILSLLEDFLKEQGFSVRCFNSAVKFLEQIEGPSDLVEKDGFGHLTPLFDLVISDIKMPGMNGMDFVAQFRKVLPQVPVVLATAFGSIDSAIEAMRLGAFDYVTTPLKLVEFRVTIDKALQYRRLERENESLRHQVLGQWSFGSLVGKCKPMQDLFSLISRVAQSSSNVLITGESGTGKEQVAKAIHAKSSRFDKPFVALNCSAIPDALLESELFGHTKGAFTGAVSARKGLLAEAHNGTVFLDEIGDISMAVQAKLLRVIQERKIKPVGQNEEINVDIRILAATHKDLKQACREGNFREDLFYRLCVIPVVIPPLRQRTEDIPLLVEHILGLHASRNACRPKGISSGALSKLMNLKFRGNVRELENILERALVLSQGDIIDERDIDGEESVTTSSLLFQAQNELVTLSELESRYIEHVLARTGGRKDQAAQILGVNRRTIYRWEQAQPGGASTQSEES